MSAPAAALSAVHVDGITVEFGGFRALDAVAVDVRPGERHAVIGPNGAGKTTLLRVIAGALRPTTGRVLLFGEDVTTVPEHRRPHRGIGRTFQITNLFLHLTVLENVTLALHGLARTKWAICRPPTQFPDAHRRALAQLDSVGLAHRAADPARTLSHGEQRQLEIAVALVARPRVLLLDEPAAGLAAGERQLMSKLIGALPRDTAVVLIEHDLTLTMSVADRITVLHHGQIVATGGCEEIQANAEVRRIYLGGGRADHG